MSRPETSGDIEAPLSPPANQYRYQTQEEIGALFGFGVRSMRALVSMPGFPIVAKKINAQHFHRWLWDSKDVIGKLVQ